MRVSLRILLAACSFVLGLASAVAQAIPPPEEVIGHRPGADYSLADWNTILNYYRLVGERSPRVSVRSIGRSTEGREMIVAEISAPETIRNIEGQYQIQRRLHEGTASDEDLARAKTIILVNLSMHSTEVGASQMGMELLYELATRNDESAQEVLRNCVIQLVACANPDGLDKVKEWYDRTRAAGKEGAPMPWLYQKYVGHDNNRDWWLVSQQETKNVTHYLYKVSFPTIVYDVHQMGGSTARMFVPPFHDPTNPNIDPRITQGIFLIGAHMAAALAMNDKRGVVWGAIYDNWWQGGMRTTPQRHNIVAVLTETASANLASPVDVRPESLRGATRGLPSYDPYVNFPDPWPGGRWSLRDIVEYQKITCWALFDLGAKHRKMWVENQRALAQKAIALGKQGSPFAWVIPPDQRQPEGVRQLLESLMATGVRAYRATSAFTADGTQYPAGTIVLPCAQPYRNHLKDLMEVQRYPRRFLYPGGPAEPPYDVAGWTAPLQMGVEAVQVDQPFEAPLEELSEPPKPSAARLPEAPAYVLPPGRVDNVPAALRLGRQGFTIGIVYEEVAGLKPGTMIVHRGNRTNDSLREALAKEAAERFLDIQPLPQFLPSGAKRLALPRIALYQPWIGNMDEGWTRFILEKYGVEYTSVHNSEFRSDDMLRQFDVIVFADQSASSILEGTPASRTFEEYSGGIGEDGLRRLEQFVRGGGTLVLMDSASELAQRMGLPIRNALSGLRADTFFCPGSILRIIVDSRHPVGYGMPVESVAYFADSRAFEIGEGVDAHVVARYGEGNPLLSGFLLGEEHLSGKPAIVDIRLGEGHILLFGFRVQYRGQSLDTFPLLFNSFLRGASLPAWGEGASK
jgi:hypothetical protein